MRGSLTSYKSIADILELEKFDDAIYIGELLFVWDMAWLTEYGGKYQSFPDGRGCFVNVHLLAIASHSLE
jgi:hypothetical protein